MTHDETQSGPQPEEQALPEAQQSTEAAEAATCDQAETTSADAQV
jgi:hypothetical protein